MSTCDMGTWPRSAMWSSWVFSLTFGVRFLCDSVIVFSWYCCEHEEFNLFVSILDQPTTSTSRSQLELFGLAGWWLCKASLRLFLSQIFFWQCSWFPHNQDHRPEWSKCLVALLLRPNVGVLPFILWMALRWELFLTCSTILPAKLCPKRVVTCFFVSLPWTHTSFWRTFVEHFEPLSDRSRVQTVTCLHLNLTMVASWSTSKLFFVSSSSCVTSIIATNLALLVAIFLFIVLMETLVSYPGWLHSHPN